MNTAVPSDTLSRLGNLMVWLGGGNWRDIDDHAERSTYQSAGFFVLLNAIIAWGVATFAVAGLTQVSPWAALPFTLVCGLLVGAFGRILATAVVEPGRRRVMGDGARAGVAVLIGLVVGEMAALAIFTGPINRELNDQVDAARASVAASDRGRQLESLRVDRARVDERVAAAEKRRDAAQVVARCEYNPTSECPSERITGDSGDGRETNLAEVALAKAEADLDAARAEREQEAPRLDQAIDRVDGQLDGDRDRAEALARADTGLDARWRAMHTYTTDNPVAMVLRMGIVGFFVLLNLLPLLLRIWRGQTDQDRRIAARRLRNRAEEEADTAIALKRAEVRVTRELRMLEAPLVHAEVVSDEERRGQTRDRPALPVGRQVSPEGDNLPVPAGDRAVQAHRSGPLAALPGPLPQVARVFGGLVRPLVPSPVIKLAENAQKPVRVARTLLEEVEEFQFSVLRKRKVTLTEEKPENAVSKPEDGEQALRRSAVASRILDSTADTAGALEADRRSDRALSAAEQRARRELPLGETVPELPHAERSELPPGPAEQ
ncbi:MAG: DUF4407 domain-containing protein [Haloechinothrix sp.]